MSYLLKVGFKDEKTLIEDFKRWLDQFLVVIMYANDPNRELVKLNLRIVDIGLPKWTERIKHSYHQIPLNYKMSDKRFCHIRCNERIHSEYVYKYFSDCVTDTERAKAAHGFHCSLSDVHELLLYYLETRT